MENFEKKDSLIDLSMRFWFENGFANDLVNLLEENIKSQTIGTDSLINSEKVPND